MIYLLLFFAFFKIGLFTFGGGYAMLPLISAEVEAHQWMTMEQLVDFLAVSESTPGPLAVNISTYVGIEAGGILGAFCATLGVIMPSFVVILLIAGCYTAFRNHFLVRGVMMGLKPAVVGLIGAAVISVGKTAFFSRGADFSVFKSLDFYLSVILFFLAVAAGRRKLQPVLIILLSAVLGITAGLTGMLEI